jgi:signal peptidase I
MPRVDDVAKELNLTTDEVRARLSAMGESVDGDASEVSRETLERLRAEVGAMEGADLPADPDATAALPAASEAPAGDGVIRSPEPPATTKVERKRPVRRVLRAIAELPILIIVAFLIAVLIKTFLVQAFFIPSGSMVPTLRVGDRVLVEKISYFVGDPGRGDVVVFARSVFGQKRPDVPWYEDARNYLRELLGLPTGQEEDYIKRIVAVGGDTIRYEGKPRQLFVNGEKVDEQDYIKGGRDTASETLTSSDCRGLKMKPAGGGCRVPAGEVFVMGDNRTNSQDSRVIGPVDEDKIVGRAFLIIWPVEDFGTI